MERVSKEPMPKEEAEYAEEQEIPQGIPQDRATSQVVTPEVKA